MGEPYVPHAYQKIATQFLLDTPRCMLAAEPGLGKTAATLMAIDALKLAGSRNFPVLVIAPKHVANVVWTGQQERWSTFSDLKVRRILGEKNQRSAALRGGIADIYTTNYENIEWLVETTGDKWPFKTVVADESTRLKSFRLSRGGRRATALSRVAKHTGRWWNLTGTPSPNGLQDLWGQMWFVDFGERLKRTYTSFLSAWFEENQYTRAISPRPTAAEDIHRCIEDVVRSFRTEDWFDIEKPRRTNVEVCLPTSAQRTYAQLESEFFAEIGETEIEALSAAAKSSKLLQLASGSVYDADHVAHHVHDAKVEALASIVAELNEPVLVAYWWKFDPPRILKAFPAARVYKTEQDRIDWNAGRIPMLLINPKSAGHGLDLQDGGRAIVYYSRTWDLELMLQVLERIGPARQAQSGHKRAVLVFDIVAKNTMDEEAVERVDSKRSVQDALMLARSRRGPHRS